MYLPSRFMAAWHQNAMRLLLGFALGLSSSHALSQTLSSYIVSHLPRQTMDAVAERFEVIARRPDGSYEVYVPHAKRSAFLALAPDASLNADDIDAKLKQQWAKTPAAFAGYHTFATVESYLKDLVANHPDIAALDIYGRSKGGLPLYVLKLSENVKAPNDGKKKKLFLDAATHGDEIITVEVLIALVDELVKGFGTDERLTKMLQKNEIYVAPVVNPDGYVHRQRYDEGVDPNRSYPWPEQPQRVPTTSIKSLIDLFAKHVFDGSITFHAFGKLLMYPWAYTEAPISNNADETFFDQLTTQLAAGNGYSHGSIANTIYVAKGSSADYYYWKFKTKALAVELTTSKAPASSSIPAVVNEAREMTWGFIEAFE